jgi:hypothetical protein
MYKYSTHTSAERGESEKKKIYAWPHFTCILVVGSSDRKKDALMCFFSKKDALI